MGAKWKLIGIDCAVDPSNVGLALGTFEGEHARVVRYTTGGRVASLTDTILNWADGDLPVLLALDAPLGWPSALGTELEHHSAGQPIFRRPNDMFRRYTDKVVRAQVGRQPLDIGADRIARTAHAALRLLQELRESIREPIPLAWKKDDVIRLAAIEVYPAATLIAHGLLADGYKSRGAVEKRDFLIAGLAMHLSLPRETGLLLENADALDAVVCVLAGVDFLLGEVLRPDNLALAQKEGWIWVRNG